jgi:HEAT repeat protein
MDWFTGSKQGEVKRLISQLADSVKRDSAARELIKLGADAVPPLIDSLQSQDPNLVLYCQHILARIPAATPLLVKALATAHPLVRGRVADVFGITKDNSVVPALLDAAKGEFFTVRVRAALALANIGDPRVVNFLLPLLKDGEAEVRSAACVAIAKFNDPTTFDEITAVLLDDPLIEVRQSAARALGGTKHSAALPFLMEALRDSSWWFEQEQAAADLLDAIKNMGPSAIEPLIEALQDREGTVRRYAARVLGEMGDVRAIEELGMTLYDLHVEVGRAAAEALAKFGAPAVDILVEALSHPEAAVREHAVTALGLIQDVRVAPALVEMLRDPDREVVRQSILALGKLNDARAESALREIASSRADRELSMLAKQALGRA